MGREKLISTQDSPLQNSVKKFSTLHNLVGHSEIFFTEYAPAAKATCKDRN